MKMLRQSGLEVPLLILLLLWLTVPISVRSLLLPLPKQLSNVGTNWVSSSISTSNSLGPESRLLGQPTIFFQSHRLDRDIETGRPKRGRISNAVKKCKRYSLPFIASVYFWFGLRVPEADARLTEQTTIEQVNFDLRSDHAAEESIRGGSDVLERKEQRYAEIPTVGNSEMRTSTKENPRHSNKSKKEKKKAKKSKSIYGDIEDGDFEDDFGFDDDAPKQPNSVTKADIARAQAMQSNTAQMQFMAYKKKDPYLKLKVGAAIFIPTFGGQSLREFYRRRKEETYVQKGLEIMRAQEKEYFNITNTTADSDVVDELKKLKDKDKDDDDSDDDDEDSDDDQDNDVDDSDDDDDDEPDRSRRPKKPRGGGPKNDGGGSSGTGGGFDPGYGNASDEDKERLKNLFDRS